MNYQMGGLVHAIMGVNINKDDFIKKVKNETQKDIDHITKCLKKSCEEAKQDKETLTKINDMFIQLNSKLRIRQFITITNKLKVQNNLFLCGNGYFKKIFSLNNIIIPKFDYCNWESWENKQEEIDFVNGLNKDCIYVFDDGEEETDGIYLTKNSDDGIDYSKDYLDIVGQVFDKNKDIIARKDMSDWTDFYTDNNKIEFEIEDDELINIFLLSQGQHKMKKNINKYSISLELIFRITL